MNDVFVETYMKQKMKEAIINNKDLIKEIIIETIRELKKKKTT